MNYFVLVCTIIFLGVVLHLGLFEYILGAGYRAGLGVVPILLLANLFLGIYMNLSIWYKVSDKTIYGAYITFIGAILTIVLNIILIPSIGYLGSAYATAICYIVMAAICYIAGQKFYHVPYQLNIVFKYIVLMLVFYGASIVLKNLIATSSLLINQTIDSALFILYVGYSYLQFNTLRKN